MDELVIDNLVYIPSKKAAAITGYAKDYIGQLCREGRIEAKLVGRSWYVLESSVKEHRFGKGGATVELQKPLEAPLQPEVVEARSLTHEAAEAGELQETTPSWEPASYTAEPIEEIIANDRPTSLTNTSHESLVSETKTSQLEEVQSAWQEWFSKNEMTKIVEEPSTDDHIKEEIENTITPQTPKEADEQAVPVRVSRSYPGSMDIAPELPVRPVVARTSMRKEGRVVRERVRRNRPKAAMPNLVLKSVFVSIIIVVAAVTVIGTGSLDALSPSWATKSGAINFLAGVKSVEK